MTLIQDLNVEKRSCASRQFANAQRQNVAGQDEEAALVLAAKSGDEQAFEILIGRYQQRILLAVARGFTRVREDAEDIAQQSFQKAFVHLHNFKGKSSFSTWLTRIAINEALMLLRRGRGPREVSINDWAQGEQALFVLEIPDSGLSPEDSYSQGERRQILFSAMNELPRATRRAIQLRELDERSTKETARIMGISAGAVKARVFHGRRKLRRVLQRESAGMSDKQSASGKANGLSRHQLVCSFGD